MHNPWFLNTWFLNPWFLIPWFLNAWVLNPGWLNIWYPHQLSKKSLVQLDLSGTLNLVTWIFSFFYLNIMGKYFLENYLFPDFLKFSFEFWVCHFFETKFQFFCKIILKKRVWNLHVSLHAIFILKFIQFMSEKNE